MLAGSGIILVTSTADTSDANPGDGICDDGTGGCTLRAAIEETNALVGPNEIGFALESAGPFTIRPASGLPGILEPITIDGYSQPGATRATGSTPATILVELDGTYAGTADGLYITGGSSYVTGLAIYRFSENGIRLAGQGGNVVQGNYIGTDVTGTVALGNGRGGITIDGTAYNLVGGPDVSARNLISGQGWFGVWIRGATATDNLIQGNYVGTDVTGTVALSNGRDGINLEGAPNNQIGGTTPGAGNVISGNSESGIELNNAANSTLIQGNLIGTNASGTFALGNAWSDYRCGIRVSDASNVLVGGTTPGARNVVSGNGNGGMNAGGICIGQGANNVVQGNYVGTDVSGTAALGNNGIGIFAPGSYITIGGSDPAARNVVSGNTGIGIVAGSHHAVIQGNYIGTDVTGTIALGNGSSGITLMGSYSNVIGTDGDGVNDATEGNLISGNVLQGIFGHGGNGNVIAGNLIGTNGTGTVAIPNGDDGIVLTMNTTYCRIGTNGDGISDSYERNVISGNLGSGVVISIGPPVFVTSDNVVAGNYIGTDITGTMPLGNNGSGVAIENGSPNNRVGTNGDGVNDLAERNVLSGNGFTGVLIRGSNSNVIAGNYIGTDVTGLLPLGNNMAGILLENGAHGNRIGTNADGLSDGAERNVISGNNGDGVQIRNSHGTAIAGDYIGTDATGLAALPNRDHGIMVEDSASSVIGGLTVSARNVISGNNNRGIELRGPDVTGIIIVGNYIGLAADGTVGLPGADNGISLEEGPHDNIIGGTTAGARNIISGNGNHGVYMKGERTTGNVVQGNYIGTNPDGTAAIGNGSMHQGGCGIAINAPNNLVGGAAPGTGNVISGNDQQGIQLEEMAAYTTIQGNNIGTNADGTAVIGNGNQGIFFGVSHVLVGGTDPAARNIVAGSGHYGIVAIGGGAGPESSGAVIQGNYIGTNPAGAALGNQEHGIAVFGMTDSIIGGTADGAGNVIAYNGHAGVYIGFGTGIRILSDSIYANGGLGTDLDPQGVTANDVDDSDSGPNNLQNYPILLSAVSDGTSYTAVRGELHSTPNTEFRVEVFANQTCDSSNYGEGERFRGAATVTTDAGGAALFSVEIPEPSAPGTQFTSTATDPGGNTSEFSACVASSISQIPAVPAQISPEGTVTTLTPTYAWYSVPGASRYWVQVRGDTGIVYSRLYIASAVCDSSVCAVTPAISLVNRRSYTWFVRAINEYGGSAWSPGLAFYVLLPPLSAPVEIGPSGAVTSQPVVFRWYEVTGATSYSLRVVSSRGYQQTRTVSSAQACQGGVCRATMHVLPNTSLTWYVRAQSPSDTGPWSTGMTFIVRRM